MNEGSWFDIMGKVIAYGRAHGIYNQPAEIMKALSNKAPCCRTGNIILGFVFDVKMEFEMISKQVNKSGHYLTGHYATRSIAKPGYTPRKCNIPNTRTQSDTS